MARRSSSGEGFGLLMLIIMAVILYNAIGRGWFVFILFTFVALIIAYQQYQKKQFQKWLVQSTADFSELIQAMLQSNAQFLGGLTLEQFKSAQYSFLESYYPRGEFFQRFNVFVESAWLVRNGVKRETIEGRMDEVNRVYEELDFNQVTPEVSSEIRLFRQSVVHDFQITRFKNPARALAEKAQSMKTEKAQRKYMDLAQNQLEEGCLMYPDNQELRQLLGIFKMGYAAFMKEAEEERAAQKAAKAKKV